jgi:hypothetical protein
LTHRCVCKPSWDIDQRYMLLHKAPTDCGKIKCSCTVDLGPCLKRHIGWQQELRTINYVFIISGTPSTRRRHHFLRLRQTHRNISSTWGVFCALTPTGVQLLSITPKDTFWRLSQLVCAFMPSCNLYSAPLFTTCVPGKVVEIFGVRSSEEAKRKAKRRAKRAREKAKSRATTITPAEEDNQHDDQQTAERLAQDNVTASDELEPLHVIKFQHKVRFPLQYAIHPLSEKFYC